MLAVALAVRLQDGGPVFFAHARIGRGGRRFQCLKFRSMTPDADARLQAYLDVNPFARGQWAKDHKLRDDPRVTAFGRFLRRSSLDELPQLFNVLSGEMSLVGPRPIVEAETVKYGIYFGEYCSVKPGITGLWQISGRSNVDYPARVALDVDYVHTASALLDLRILALTIPAVLAGRGSC
jgi:lipopolysaccharide/colanic/teichoic acid biosynthesis glycosyltransferase